MYSGLKEKMNEKVITHAQTFPLYDTCTSQRENNAPELIFNKSFNQRDLVIAQSLIHDDVI